MAHPPLPLSAWAPKGVFCHLMGIAVCRFIVIYSESKTIMASTCTFLESLHDTIYALSLDAGVPVVPGYHGSNQNTGLLAEEANKIGGYIACHGRTASRLSRLPCSHQGRSWRRR